jgi:hypothetical protein
MAYHLPNSSKGTFMPSPRPGAAAALQVPSLANGKRTPYKPPVAQCVGLNRGSTGLAE